VRIFLRGQGGAVLLAGALAAANAGAQEISLSRPGSGARAAGMGNAFIAVSADGTAASWNPAGLSQLRKPEFSLVHSTTGRNFHAEGYRTRDQTAAFSSLRTASSTADIERIRLVGRIVDEHNAGCARPATVGAAPVGDCQAA
jgi:long-subunit fatty acid transport protein